MAGLGIRAAGARQTVFRDIFATSSLCRQQRANLSTFGSRTQHGQGVASPHRAQMRFKSIFQHRWFHPESAPGQPPKQSYRVFWTVSLLLGGFGVAYLKWIDPYLAQRFSEKQAAQNFNAGPVFDKDNFLPFTIKRIEPYNTNTKLFTFTIPNGQATNLPVATALFAQPAAQEGVPLNEKGQPVTRWYTPISDPTTPGEFTLMIKKYDDGKLTPYIHSLNVGDKLAFKGPIKKWAYKANEFEHVGLIGGGSGITPLLQILTYALKDKANTTKFTLLYGNLTEEDILLKERFDALKKDYPNTFDVHYFVDKRTGTDKTITQGFITKNDVQKYLPGADLKEKIKVFVCGPPGQMKAISGMKAGMKQGELSGALKEAGFTEEQVYKF